MLIVGPKISETCVGASVTSRKVTSLKLIVKGEKGDVVTYSHGILARWRKHFSQRLNVHGVNDVRRTQIHTAEPLMPEPSACEFEIAIEKLKSHKSPGTDQIPAELIKTEGRTIRFEIHKLINYI
jgi:hypothetical protein